ncbi:hypothetical protein AB0K60_03225 [Thermopolyspora sp. NPDC052614]|uniref:hypothetical protein n=1 Tax=Thermopolyspora sp. NPDC052614 TaxID=3155682 RepID=UPI0034239541
MYAPTLACTAKGRDIVTAFHAAERLRAELARLQVPGVVNHGYGYAVVSVSASLTVWTDGRRYWWRAAWNPVRGRYVYAWHTADEPDRAARRVAARYARMRRRHQ